MYVDNGKISNRQTLRLFVFDLMGIATLLLPPYLSTLCGTGGVWVVLAGTAAAFVYLFYLGWLMKCFGMDIISYLNQRTMPLVRSIGLIFILVHTVLAAGFCAYIFTKLMQYSLIQESSYALVLTVILVLAAYAVSGGIESRARVYEVLFWFVLIPYVLMMSASVKNFEIEYVSGLFELRRDDFFKGVYLVFLFFTPLFFSLFLIREKEKNHGRNVIRTIAVSILIASGILLGSYILLLGNFGKESLATMQYPVVTLMSTIQFKGNFLKRMDSLMLAVWFFTLYALLNLHLHYGTSMIKEIFSNGKTKKRQVVVTSILVFGVAYAMYLDTDWVWTFVNYYSYIAVPIMVAGPAFLLLAKKKKFRSLCTAVFLGCALMLTGCSETELEERSFPMLAAAGFDDNKVTFSAAFPKSGTTGQENSAAEGIKIPTAKADEFQKCIKEYESRSNKQLDYNHLKVFVIEEDLLQQKTAYNRMLDYLAEEGHFPRNTYVCAIEDIDDLFEIEKNLPQDLGTYLEEYINKHEEGKSHILTLGDLLDEKENQTLILYMPYLEVEDDYIEWKGYVNILGETWQDSM